MKENSYRRYHPAHTLYTEVLFLFFVIQRDFYENSYSQFSWI
ncbi:hypothetical protein CTO_0989 [Chlamydia trachomatis A2497]|uniref:Uncharacterized protein n=1 Tax=Chlamydia trachomatis serovar A (strain A2497) TaxID=580047 RepID=G4NMQ0_CHLT4|nr:hypothetical protein CTO_0989 [Chlamydia trachomatis A2497]